MIRRDDHHLYGYRGMAHIHQITWVMKNTNKLKTAKIFFFRKTLGGSNWGLNFTHVVWINLWGADALKTPEDLEIIKLRDGHDFPTIDGI